MPKSLLSRDRNLWLAGIFTVSLIGYILLLFNTPREDFYHLFLLFTLLGVCYIVVLRFSSESNYKRLLWAAVIFRVALLGAVPELSDDFYRFIWDGLLWNQGIPPYAFLPNSLIEHPELSGPLFPELYDGLNSPDYFTIYPALSQLVFVISTILFPESIMGNIITMRLFLIAAEIGTLLLLPKLLEYFQIKSKNALVYAWNPLVIIELTGNLHFEALMIFFLVLTLWFWKKGTWWWSAVCLGLAVSTKLIPLIFLPLLWGRLPLKRLLAYYILTGLTIAICFIPWFDPDLIMGMSSSLSLYFQKFEFNASIYYLIREIGYAVKGWNIIETAGKYLALTTFIAIMLLAWWSRKKITWPQAMMWGLLIYLLLTTTVHPWYITPLVFLSVFSDYRFALVWSFAVIVSYAGYSSQGYQENLVLTFAEYALVLGYLVWETRTLLLPKNLFPHKSVN
ncbi:MAG: glycosyltransferase 87 family protein [Cyclobacteriaceae bacterium]|nr:glycosyltransferase 87 family protein [Cyclobacteriaceae bacterium]